MLLFVAVILLLRIRSCFFRVRIIEVSSGLFGACLLGDELVAEDDDDDVLTLSEEGSLEDDDVSSEDEDDDVDERTLEVVSRELIEEESPSSSLTV